MVEVGPQLSGLNREVVSQDASGPQDRLGSIIQPTHRSHQVPLEEAQPCVSAVHILQGHHLRASHVHYKLCLVVLLVTETLNVSVVDVEGLPRRSALQEYDIALSKHGLW